MDAWARIYSRFFPVSCIFIQITKFKKIKTSIRILKLFWEKNPTSKWNFLAPVVNWTEREDDIRQEARLMSKKVARDPRKYVVNFILKTVELQYSYYLSVRTNSCISDFKLPDIRLFPLASLLIISFKLFSLCFILTKFNSDA